MAQTIKMISRADVRGTAVGVLFMAFFGTMWAYAGIMGLQGSGSPWLLVASLIIGTLLFIGACQLIFASREIPNQVPNADARYNRNIGIWFNIIFIAEVLLIVIAIAVCNIIGYTELIPLVLAIIVGIHFLSLAYLFHVRIYYFTGALLRLLPIFTWLFIPPQVTIKEYQINANMSVVGFGSAIILWGSSLAMWIIGKRFIGLVNKSTDDFDN